MRDIERRDGPFLEGGGLKFNASFILGGQIAGEDMRLFRIYAEGNFIEAGTDTRFLQTGEAKYGKPILDLAVTPSATLEDATKCVLVSFDSTMLSNLSVGMPIDLLCYARDSLKVTMKRRFDDGRRLLRVAHAAVDRRHAKGLPRFAAAGVVGLTRVHPMANQALGARQAQSVRCADASESAAASDSTRSERTAAQAAPPRVRRARSSPHTADASTSVGSLPHACGPTRRLCPVRWRFVGTSTYACFRACRCASSRYAARRRVDLTRPSVGMPLGACNMRWLVAVSMALTCGAARCCDDAADEPDIVTVMHRSHQLRLDVMTLAVSPARARKGCATASTRCCAGSARPQRWNCASCAARLSPKRCRAVSSSSNEALGDWPEGERLFILAHEIGHVTLGHWSQVGLLYRRWIPGPRDRRADRWCRRAARPRCVNAGAPTGI